MAEESHCRPPHERDARAYINRRYNGAVPAVSPEPDGPPPTRPGKHHIFTLEAAGILVIGALILIVTLVRYWHHIAWSAR